MDVYQVAVPFGAVSRNAEFWRHVDEEFQDPATKDLMLKNGVRTGLAASDDWDFFRSQIEQSPHVSRSGSAMATGTGTIELPMRENVGEQTIFFVKDGEEPEGRTYEKCSDFFGLSFWPNPRRPGEMWLWLSPVVRSTRTHLEYTIRGDEHYLTSVTPESLYNLNLRLTIPTNRILIVGLSPSGERPSSLGHQFLTLEGGVEMKEQLLIFVPRIPNRKPPATTRSAPDIDAHGQNQ